MSAVLGFECWLGINTGNETTPTWAEVEHCKDVSIPMSKDEVEVSRRVSKFKMFRGALREVGLEFGYQFQDAADTVFDQLKDSYFDGTAVNFAVLDDDIANSGATGLKFWGEVMEGPFEQGLSDGQMFSFTVKNTDYEEPAGTLIEPDWHTT